MAEADRISGPRLRRREAMALGLTAVGSLLAGFAIRSTATARVAPLRPPGALPEREFLAACIRCFQCGSVCPNQCIQFRGMAEGPAQSYTPYIQPREQACILCMRCTQVCPTDALMPIVNDPDIIAAKVQMGIAKVSRSLCYSFAGRICGVCYYACPFPDKALRLGAGATPIIDDKACVGCGNCERACIHLPQAIRVTPAGAAA